MPIQTQFDRRQNSGILAGALACAFAVLGIFTLGFLFVPIAALCTIIGLISGIAGSNLSGIAVSALGGFLTLVGLATSPVLLLLLGISLVAHSPEIKPSDPMSASVAGAKPNGQSIASSQSQMDIPCPVGGAAAVLRGMASRSLNGKFVLKTEKPFCLTLNPPVAPRQRALLSSVEIDGQPPPLGVLIELTGKLYASPLTPDGAETPVLEVASGRRVRVE